MVANMKLARTLFGAALALYMVWIGALVALAVVSGARPAETKTRRVSAPAAAPAGSEAPRD
jgi:hypothetical protein